MSRRVTRLATAALVTAGLAGSTVLTTAPAQAVFTHVCPSGYYGVEVYDSRGRMIVWLCLRPVSAQ